VVYTGEVPGAWGSACWVIFPNGEHAQGAYTVSAWLTVVEPFPVSVRTVRPNPSRFFCVQRPLIDVYTFGGEAVSL